MAAPWTAAVPSASSMVSHSMQSMRPCVPTYPSAQLCSTGCRLPAPCAAPAPQEAVEAVEKAAQTLAGPQERLKKLLEAKDKKAMLLEMAGEQGSRACAGIPLNHMALFAAEAVADRRTVLLGMARCLLLAASGLSGMAAAAGKRDAKSWRHGSAPATTLCQSASPRGQRRPPHAWWVTAPSAPASAPGCAAANEIDRPLIDLLDQNIEGATAAKQEQAAEFMRKVKQAALRYLVK